MQFGQTGPGDRKRELIMAEHQWTPEELQALAALGLSITPHADANLGWGYTWLNRDWVGPLPTPGAAIHAAFTNALLAMQFASDYSWVLFAQPGDVFRFDGGQEWTPVKEEAAHGRDGIDQVEAHRREIKQSIRQDPAESTDHADL